VKCAPVISVPGPLSAVARPAQGLNVFDAAPAALGYRDDVILGQGPDRFRRAATNATVIVSRFKLAPLISGE
jgi:hypothetical protein